MSAAIATTGAFDAMDQNHDGVISRTEFAQASGAVFAEPVATYAAPMPAYSASPVTYAAAPGYAGATTYAAAPVQYTSAAAPVTYTAAPVTYAAAPVTYAAPEYATSSMVAQQPVYYSQPDAFAAMDANGDGVISRGEFANAGVAQAPAYTFAQPYAMGQTYVQGKVYDPVLFTQESFLAYQQTGQLPPPPADDATASVKEVADAATAKDSTVEEAAAQAAKVSKKVSAKAKKSSKKKKGCC